MTQIRNSRRFPATIGSTVIRTGLAAVIPLMLTTATPAYADAERVVEDPPQLQLRKGPPTRTTLMPLPKPGPSPGQERQLELNIVYSDSQLYNPATGRYD
ncbi:hypothetical protein [Methylocaldum szegediense]|uniref:Uncharacterized protein n=1 Tax=Methylocaldum szegediense TaxID=73780 RepID=A0ABN8X670_9GAMM|nr:hypothetical protein [Methylocaldum szegediense]CAI8902905.1 protein of unknown function [Methylocaldum szegediense]